MRVSGGELRDAWQAQLALLRALVRVRTRPVGALVATGAPRTAGGGDHQAREDGREPAAVPGSERAARRQLLQRLELALARAGRRGLFRPSCLVRSLALAELLERHGVRGAEIRIGVRPRPLAGGEPRPPAPLEAHAWVELDGQILGEDARSARRFTPLGGLRAAEPPSGPGPARG